jgi:RND family efflux transporter MFP subunit
MKKGTVFKIFRVLIVLIVSFAIMVMLVVMKPEAERQVPKQNGLLVEVMPVQAEQVNLYVEAYGTVRPCEALSLVAEVRGQVVDIDPLFEEGSFIPQETVMIQIDPRTYRLEVDRRRVQVKQAAAEIKRLNQEVINLKARLKIAQSDVALAKNEYQRLKKLIDKKVIAQSQLDKTEQAYLASQERLQSLKNQLALTRPMKEQLIAQREMAAVLLQEAELDLERTAIIAPFDGWVLEKSIEKGQHVNTGQYLGKIYNDGELEIEVRIPVKDFEWLPADMDRNSSSVADILFESGEIKFAWKGHVARIKAQLDEKTRTLPVIIETDTTMSKADSNGNFRLRPGMFVNVRIKGRKIDSAYVLPRHLVYPGNVVYLVEENQLIIRTVGIVRSYKDIVIINEGLSDGELIITSPISAATEGMPVRLSPDGS